MVRQQDLSLALSRMAFFGDAHGWGVEGGARSFPSLKYVTQNLSTVIPYPKRIQKLYELRDTPLEF